MELARAAEDLGCHRFWVAEHHGGAQVPPRRPWQLWSPITIRIGGRPSSLRVAAADSRRTVDALVAGFAGVMAGGAHLPREARRQLVSGALPTMGSCLTDDRLPPVPEVGSALVRGDGEELRASLAEYLDRYAPDEVMVTLWSSGLAGRIRALEIIREALPG